jgi:hypothetical protein
MNQPFETQPGVEPFPYNLPPWRARFELRSPDGRWLAKMTKTQEFLMSSPREGVLEIVGPMRFNISRCMPAFVWSEDSRILAVPQWRVWARLGQRLLLVAVDAGQVFRSRRTFKLFIPERFSEGMLVGSDLPLSEPSPVSVSVAEMMATSSVSRLRAEK